MSFTLDKLGVFYERHKRDILGDAVENLDDFELVGAALMPIENVAGEVTGYRMSFGYLDVVCGGNPDDDGVSFSGHADLEAVTYHEALTLILANLDDEVTGYVTAPTEA